MIELAVAVPAFSSYNKMEEKRGRGMLGACRRPVYAWSQHLSISRVMIHLTTASSQDPLVSACMRLYI
jgi:hypothetical protein